MQILEKIKNKKRFSKWQGYIKKVINVIITIVMFLPNKIYAATIENIAIIEDYEAALYGPPNPMRYVKSHILPIVLIIRINSLL